MIRPESIMLLDPNLQAFVEAETEVQTDLNLTQLMIEQAEPVIKEIVGSKLRTYLGAAKMENEYEDVCSEVRVQLLARLIQLKENPSLQAIRDFRGYVAVTSYRACAAYLRRKYPHRFHLKHKLRFLLSHRTEFRVWETGAEKLAGGFAEWDPTNFSIQNQRRLHQLRTTPEVFVQTALPRGTVANLHLGELVAAIFNWVGQPIELDELTAIVAELCGIQDHINTGQTAENSFESKLEQMPDLRANIDQTLGHRRYLEKLWSEIKKMSPRHCAALLLNLKDEQGQSATDLLILTGVVSVSQLAQALDLTEMELMQIWNQLPLDDLTIAERLGLKRQQVINLRKTARERLARFLNSPGL